MCKAYNIETMSPSNPVQEWRDVAHLTEWAQREKLGARFESGIEALVKQGGLCTTTDKFLEELGYRLPAMRKKIMEAIKTKFRGNRKVRFGQIVKYEPILKKRPNGKCPWTEIDHNWGDTRQHGAEGRRENMALLCHWVRWSGGGSPDAEGIPGHEAGEGRELGCAFPHVSNILVRIHRILLDSSFPESFVRFCQTCLTHIYYNYKGGPFFICFHFLFFVFQPGFVASVIFVGVWLLWLYHALPIYLSIQSNLII